MMATAPRIDASAGFESIFPLYAAALAQTQALLETLQGDGAQSPCRNPIHHMISRVKSEESIREKLARKRLPVSPQSARTHLHDIAGLRVICPTVADVYALAAWIRAQAPLRLYRESDYIAAPKRSGYRSLHLIVETPVHRPGGVQWVQVEIQLRTPAMDLWATLEHQLCYKKDAIPPEVTEELRRCADTIAGVDRQMQRLHERMRD